MAITDINISEQLQTDAPSIKYTGNEGPQASPQHQQEQMIAQQIWEALSPEQQGQFQSFEQFFQSGIWKQILQQMQQDEAQGQTRNREPRTTIKKTRCLWTYQEKELKVYEEESSAFPIRKAKKIPMGERTRNRKRLGRYLWK
jgi:hypothetical protein